MRRMADGVSSLVLPRVPPMPGGDGLPLPLGTFQGHAILRRADGRAIAVRHDRLGRSAIAALYAGRPEILSRTWPRARRGWDHWLAALSITAACAAIGRVEPEQFGIAVTYRAPGTYRCRRKGGASTCP